MSPRLQSAIYEFNERDSLITILTTMLARLFEMLHEQMDLIVMFFGESQSNPDVQKRLNELIRQGVQSFYDILSTRTEMEVEYLQTAIRNVLMVSVMYFLSYDRFTSNLEGRKKYIDFTVIQLVDYLLLNKLIKERGNKRN